ncbi:MAG: glycosyltransferase 2 family protein [Kosmotogales bacterium]|nr:glycosyltransferase 2 family protein [Kosmotogales bacterium]
MIKRKTINSISSLVGAVIFIIAVYVIYKNLKNISINEIIKSIQNFNANKIILSVSITFLVYLNLSFYDFLPVLKLNLKLPYKKVLPISFISYSFSKNFGMNVLSSGSVRFRLYGVKQISVSNIIIITVYAYLTYWLGFLCLVSINFFLLKNFIFGSLSLIILFLYLVLVIFRKKPLKIKNFQFKIPNLKTTFFQIAISCFDILFSFLVFLVLLSDQVKFSVKLFNDFIFAQLLGISSQVPGGLGVFEALIISRNKNIDVEVLFSSLILYRLVFYFSPLIIAMIIYSYSEIKNRRGIKS